MEIGNRTLRIGFAMGGGVSLGTFQGSALAEALKILILRGRYEDKEPASTWKLYKKVEIDVFSGASAGSLSLGVMLRELASFTSSATMRNEALQKLIAQFGKAEIDALPASKRVDLIAAQLLWEVQRKVWVKEISINRLLSDGEDSHHVDDEYDLSDRKLDYSGGVVNRAAVESIAKDYFDFSGSLSIRPRILSERVLFASSLTNVTPILADARGQFGSHDLSKIALVDGLTSKAHKEMRVFDLYMTDQSAKVDEFKDPDLHPGRWYRFHAADEKKGVIANLQENKSWAKIASTCIASGAFPMAFEPVVLERKGFEYGYKKDGKTFNWPTKIPKDADEYPFTYVDGGTLNNEPIREAFRLASFIDGETRARGLDTDFDRAILFVDPATSEGIELNVGIHRRYDIQNPNLWGSRIDGYDLIRRSSLDRLLPHIGALLTIISNESRVIEGDKAYQVREHFNIRNKIRKLVPSFTVDNPKKSVVKEMANACQSLLSASGKNELIPPGQLNTAGEVERIISEEEMDGFKGLASSFLDDPDAFEPQQKKKLFEALIMAAVDIVMGLEGKMQRAQLIGIAPLDLNSKKLIKMPGGKLAGFAGFMSEEAGEYEAILAQYCARMFLETSGIIVSAAAKPMNPGLFDTSHPDYQDYLRGLDRGVDILNRRVKNMVGDASPWFAEVIEKLIGDRIKNALNSLIGPKFESYEFRIIIKDDHYVLDGKGPDSKPKRIQNKLALITVAEWNTETRTWSGPFVSGGGGSARIRVDRRGFLGDRKYASFELPTISQIKKIKELPLHIFTTELKPTDKKKNSIHASRWSSGDKYNVTPLHETLFLD